MDLKISARRRGGRGFVSNTMFGRVKYLSTAIITAVIVSFVLALAAFACPDSDKIGAHRASHVAAGDMGGRKPCDDAKEELCASVRESMLSIRAPQFRVDGPARSFFLSPPIKTESFAAAEFFHRDVFVYVPYHPIFKRPLYHAYSVLRI